MVVYIELKNKLARLQSEVEDLEVALEAKQKSLNRDLKDHEKRLQLKRKEVAAMERDVAQRKPELEGANTAESQEQQNVDDRLCIQITNRNLRHFSPIHSCAKTSWKTNYSTRKVDIELLPFNGDYGIEIK